MISNRSFASSGESGSSSSSSSFFACPVCSKVFRRRDLKERHRRRCEKAIGKVRLSRQKSCSSCVVSKTRCDLRRPSCQRCLSRGIKCVYKNQTTTDETPADRGVDAFSAVNFDKAGPIFLLGDADDGSYSGTGVNLTSQSPQLHHSFDEPSFDLLDFSQVDQEYPTLIGDFTTHLPHIQPEAASVNGFTDSFFQDASTQPFLEPSLAGVSNESRGSSGISQARDQSDFIVGAIPSTSHSNSNADDISSSTSSNIKSSMDISQSEIQFGRPSTLSISSITHTLCDYPQQMLSPGFSSPFLHRNLYRTEDGYVESWAVSLCCISATSLSLQSSVRFLRDTINKERERLVKGFPVHCTEFAETIPFLHATCVYQIISLLIPHSTYKPENNPELSMPELHHSFLVKMARCLLKSVTLDHFDTNNLEWYRWILLESLRRTVFFANLVNEMCFHTKALTDFYFEEVDDARISRLPLPAPESMWSAQNSDEWAAARDASNWFGSRIPTIERIARGETTLEDSYLPGTQPEIVPIIVSCYHWKDRSF